MRRFARIVLVVVAGCGGHESDAPTDSGGVDTSSAIDVAPVFDVPPVDACAGEILFLSPSDSVLTIDTATTPPTPATQTYTAGLGGCVLKDVTAEVALDVDPSIGTCVANRFTSVTSLPSPWGAIAEVHATAEGLTGLATLTLVQLRASGDRQDALFSYLDCTITPARRVLAVHGSSTTSDLGARVSNGARNAFDASPLVGVVRAMTEGDTASGCAPHAATDTNGDGVADTFTSVTGETVCFEVKASSPPVARTSTTQFVAAYVDFVAPSDATFTDRRALVFVVGPKFGKPC